MRKFAPEPQGPLKSRFMLRLEQMCQFTWPLFLFLLIALIGIGFILFFQLRSTPPVTAPIEAHRNYSSSSSGLLNESNFIDSYVQASGGQAALSAMTSIRAEGQMRDAANEWTFRLTKRRPNFMLLELSGDNGVVTYGYDGAAFWQKREGDSAQAELGFEVGAVPGRMRGLEDFFDPLLAYALDGEGIIQLIEYDEWQGETALRIQMRRIGSSRIDVFLDPETLRIRGLVERVGSSAENRTVAFEDYRNVDGCSIPFTRRVSVGGVIVYEMKLTACALNPDVAPALFSLPKD